MKSEKGLTTIMIESAIHYLKVTNCSSEAIDCIKNQNSKIGNSIIEKMVIDAIEKEFKIKL